MSGTKYRELFEALAAPFDAGQVKRRAGGGGRQLEYITSRTAMIRLDEVIGPENWGDEYYEVCGVLFCRITITLPDGTKVSKSDAGGFKEMTEKTRTGETIKDEENTDKTGPSDAFKRAAAKFGVARYLYKDGVAHLQEATPDAPAADAPAPEARPKGKAKEAAPKSLPELFGRMLKKWGEADGDDSEATATARRKRIVNRLVSDAVKAGHVDESKVNQPNGHRDARKAEGCMEWLWQYQRDWTIKAAAAYLREKLDEAAKLRDAATNPDAPIPDEIQQALEN